MADQRDVNAAKRTATGDAKRDDPASRRGKFFYLFVALLGLVAIYPFFEVGGPRRIFLVFIAMAIPAAGVYAAGDSRRNFIIATALGVASLFGGLEALAGVEVLPGSALGLLFALVFYIFIAGVIVSHVLGHEEVATDTLFGAACVYLLLGLVWMVAYTLLERVHPGSFHFSSVDSSSGVPSIFDFLYFSIVTLTTLGYGDVAPVTARARSLAMLEAIVGVLFIALLIARLVGLYRRKGLES